MYKFFSIILLTLSIFLLSYIFYKSEIFLDGENRNYYIFYYIVAFSILIFSILTFFIKKYILDYLYIILVSTLISLYLVESYFYFFKKENVAQVKINGYKKITGKDYDTRTKKQVYNDLKGDGAVVAVWPYLFLREYSIKLTPNKIFPLSGISNKKTINCNERGYYAIYNSDRFGFNNPDNEWDKQNIQYLLIGDSYLHGACVDRPHDITSVLRTISKKSALNLGYGGNGPLMELATLREFYKKNSKNVIWIYYERNDLSDLDSELNEEILKNYMQYENFSQNLKSRQPEIDNITQSLMELEFKKEYIDFFKLKKTRSIFLSFKNANNQFKPKKKIAKYKEFEKILRIAKDYSIKNGSNFFFVYLPEHERYITRYDNEKYNRVKDIIKKLDINFIDIHEEVFKKEKDPLDLFPFRQKGHYTIEGYKKVATKIFDVIEK